MSFFRNAGTEHYQWTDYSRLDMSARWVGLLLGERVWYVLVQHGLIKQIIILILYLLYGLWRPNFIFHVVYDQNYLQYFQITIFSIRKRIFSVSLPSHSFCGIFHCRNLCFPVSLHITESAILVMEFLFDVSKDGRRQRLNIRKPFLWHS